jgi:hypothetical protein
MAQEFQLRLITQRASGGDPIVRERHVAGPEATIGRAPDNDIVLADLSIDPQHARMRFAGPGRVAIESVGGLGFEVAGRKTQRAEVDLASRPVATFGSYALAFEPDEHGDAVVTVTQDDHERHLTPSEFSLKAKVFGRRAMAWTFGLTILLLCLIVPLAGAEIFAHMRIHPDQQWSAGPLSKAHGFLETDCKACHTNAFVSVRDAACKACHQNSPDAALVAKAQDNSRRRGSPFQPVLVVDHGRPDLLLQGTPSPRDLGGKIALGFAKAFNHPTGRCASCHIEHTPPHGSGPAADKPLRVAAETCQGCHTGLKDRLSHAGRRIDFGDAPSWGKHPPFRTRLVDQTAPGAFAVTRVAFAPGLKETSGLTFSHQQHLDPTGGVARQALGLARYRQPLDCQACHEPVAGGGYRPVDMKKDCADCHSLAYARVGGELKYLPHGSESAALAAFERQSGGGGMAGGSTRERPGTIAPTLGAAPSASAMASYRAAISRGGVCFGCHELGVPAAGQPDVHRVKLNNSYMPKGDFNHAIPAHNQFNAQHAPAAKCADCHAARTSTQASDVLMPTKAACEKCHAAQPQVAKELAGGTTCETCHSFHTPGRASRSPLMERPLETLRWSEAAGKPAV